MAPDQVLEIGQAQSTRQEPLDARSPVAEPRDMVTFPVRVVPSPFKPLRVEGLEDGIRHRPLGVEDLRCSFHRLAEQDRRCIHVSHHLSVR